MLSFIYLDTDNNPCNDGGPYSESTPQIIKAQAQGFLPDIIGVGSTYKNCDPEYKATLLEYRYLLLLHAFHTASSNTDSSSAFAGCIVTSCQEKKT